MSRGVSGSPIAGLVLGGLRALLLVTAFLVAATASAQEPLAVHYEYQLDDGVGEGQRETLERALGIVAGFLNDTFVVRRPDDESSLLLEPTCMKWRTISYPGGGGSRDECVEYSTACGKARPPPSLFRAREVCDERRVGDCEVVGEGNQGVPGAQLVVYLTAVDGPGCSSGSEVGELASATHCTLSVIDGRPTSGNVNVCPETIRRASEGSDREFYFLVDTLAHEHLHIIGFNSDLYESFVGDDGEPLGEQAVLEPSQLALRTPRVVEAARAHFDCEELSSVPLESEGGSGTAGSHWPHSLVGSRELMAPTVGSGRSVISSLTYALIEDTGWFEVRPGARRVGELDFGKGIGCAVLDRCDAEPNRFFCQPGQAGETACSSDYYGVGVCTGGGVGSTCPSVQTFDNMRCREPSQGEGSLGYDPLKWGQSYGPGSRCLPISSDPAAWQRGNAFAYEIMDIGGGGGCFNVRCDGGGTRVMVSMGGEAEAECPEGGYLEASSLNPRLRQGKIGPCPPPKDICPGLACEEDCGGRGDCAAGGECRCFLGHGGPACALDVPDDFLPPTTVRSQQPEAEAASVSASEAPAAVDSPKVPWMVVAVGSIVVVGIIVIAVVVTMLVRRRRSGRGARDYRRASAASGRRLVSEMAAGPALAAQPAKQEPGLLESKDLDGGVVGVKAHTLLYGSDIRIG
ncbi:leishmanolysin-like zinc metallopeptidase [Chloropicon roscoffensis]|uniref:Leishmanolysin-like zinc metallopeptidase n=1 Tax=Chloropicon roscoffensis TaxID=1461544 RepID=A0A7S3FST2_9CHLO|mmetsp:Transcript_9290/g.28183  ORF Transcript_9290/g.28183 Transcript_9290/m.28183 type:complete len:687 (+) Transcript_9290:118-2178(+)